MFSFHLLLYLSVQNSRVHHETKELTYMVAVNPATRSRPPTPIVCLWWKLWLSLNFAGHFIFFFFSFKVWNELSQQILLCVKQFESIASLSRVIVDDRQFSKYTNSVFITADHKEFSPRKLSTTQCARSSSRWPVIAMKSHHWNRFLALVAIVCLSVDVAFSTIVEIQQHQGIYFTLFLCKFQLSRKSAYLVSVVLLVFLRAWLLLIWNLNKL